MNITMSLLLKTDALDAELDAFCTSDPKYQKAKQEFDVAAEEIARRVGFDLYDTFERSFNDYLFRTADLYYLYGLGLRQELLQALVG